MRFRVRYGNPAELVTDHEQQFVKGGFLVRVTPPDGLELYADVELELAGDFGATVLNGQVVQMVPNVGVAVAFQPSDDLAALVDAARAAGGRGGGSAQHTIGGAERPAQPAPDKAALGRAPPSGKAALIHEARYGKKDARMRIIRGGDRSLHRYVLNNPGLGLDEVLLIAKTNTVSPELLKAIAERSDWAQRPDIALGLVRNPKTPVPVAIKMLQHVGGQDLRQIAKMANVRMPILKAARKKVLG